MRRPAPLPASADEPGRDRSEDGADTREDATRPARARRGRNEGSAVAEAPHAPDENSITEVIEPVASRPAAEESVADGREESESTDAEVRSTEVWRAARARRKALRAEIRRFTQRSRRRRIVWWASLGAVAALVLGSVVAAYSPLFAVREITVVGAEAVDPTEVQQALQGQLGVPLALVDGAEVKSALTEFPIIETYALEARPPHELLVRIVERTPIGVVKSDAGYSLLDAAGVVLATTPKRPKGQPRLEVAGGIESAAFRSAGLVMRSLPADLRETVTEVRASSGDDVSFSTSDGKTVIWGGEGDSVRKAEVLVSLIEAAPDARTFDVSSPTVPVAG
ncbi:FtsQ-type POTRA domain-containing protein [Microbacterium esteraromaticum]|uniref:FtsQ-type POTRA domain-containing protein n=1 Tax=Microbacterium esteraromaticum TaxID=57043 RepID=A0A939DYP1_9MICO|nr:FtsQ-type POTRA domain-containing protein [Microbacterium esteraromaticum]MBN7792162.1 FtsQ-type POTRA domain-containing protein [Microbacterium esteraromaticum]MBN8206458.1 FtsQ-type POTRA domain-containing protein [Microbacterium esteraromaticum]MBN8416613.1 FtsQ-type POTRA domain-containing protein [Microbacterium esteraromaticum]MCA1308042.1 FtsQ-type POTRA domain-containing protein [Microbacterium esteraromaticum]